MTNLICPDCKMGKLIEHTGEYESTYRDRNERSHQLMVPGVTWLECDACGEALLDDYAMSVIEAARRKALGLLSPEEIRSFRTSLRKTQSSMSALLGIGEKTYTRWESGAYIQSEAFDRYLRLLMEKQENISLLLQIVNAKKGELKSANKSTREGVFDQINDVARVRENGRVFVDLFVCGALYVN